MSAESCYDRSCETVPGIDIKNAETFFKMLVELQGEDTIDASTFANACVRMKGAATSIDLQTVMFTTHLMNKDSGKPMHRLNSLNSVAHNWNFLCFCIFRRNRPNIDACFVANTFEPIGFNTFFVLGVCGPTFILGAAKLVEWRGFWKWIFVHTLLHLAASCARRPIVNSILFDTCFTPPMLNPNTAWFIYVLAIQDRGSQADRRNAETLPGATKSLPEFVCSFGADWVRDECRHFWICGLRVPDFWRFTRGRWPTVNPRCAFTSWSSQTKTKVFFSDHPQIHKRGRGWCNRCKLVPHLFQSEEMAGMCFHVSWCCEKVEPAEDWNKPSCSDTAGLALSLQSWLSSFCCQKDLSWVCFTQSLTKKPCLSVNENQCWAWLVAEVVCLK